MFHSNNISKLGKITWIDWRIRYFPVWLPHRLISAGLETVSSYAENKVYHRTKDNFPRKLK